MLRQKFVSPPTNRDGIFNFESSKKWAHAHTVLGKKKKAFYSLMRQQQTVDYLQAVSLNVHAAVGKRRLVHWSRLCLKIHHGAEKMTHLCLLHWPTVPTSAICHSLVPTVLFCKTITKYYMQILDVTHSRLSQLYQFRPHWEKSPCILQNQSINAVYFKNHSKIFYLQNAYFLKCEIRMNDLLLLIHETI